MESDRDFSSIVHSPPFTFLVGPNHTKLTIQSGLARHVSQPLDHLMNSGETRESKHHIAVLEEYDVETFVAFCEYAYTGDYRKKNKKDKKKKKGAAAEEAAPNLTPPSTPPPSNSKPEEEAANPASETNAVSEDVPPAPETAEIPPAPEPADTAAAAASSPTESWEHTAPTPPEDGADAPSKEDNKDPKEETQQKEREESKEHQGVTARRQTGPMIDTSFARQQYSRMNEKGTSLWDEFSAIDYVDPRSCSVTRPPSVMSARSPFELPYLVFHAKLYVFATRYLIPALAQLCLRKLHRDLLYLGFAESSIESEDEEQHSLNTTKARKILDLLHYTYTKTTRLEPITPTSATQLRDNELRKLVVHFAACKVRDLAAYSPPVESDLVSPSSKPLKPSARGFRALLDTTTELASDLVYRMMM
ncbi:similar to An16g08360 [Aspergillus luchuensis]|uniref:Similar to An16g08360 n=1 Tax=Aspergillus kawachii TaxID=1069201 RepID=A0A146FTG8_ASPKA|nr:similar to An16g08360 [Aspergillus luchuensis]